MSNEIWKGHKSEQLEIIRDAVAKATGNQYKGAEYLVTIRLADVLLAISKEGYIVGDSDAKEEEIMGTDQSMTLNLVGLWNLRKDSLEDQSEETLQFLADLLTH